MKIAQVQRVVLSLILSLLAVRPVLCLEFQAEDQISCQENRIDSSLAARNRIFKKQSPIAACWKVSSESV